MSFENLKQGLEFSKKHKLTQKEMEVIIPFLDKPYTTFELSKYLNVNKVTLHSLIQRLKLKGLLILKDIDSSGNYLYEFKTTVYC